LRKFVRRCPDWRISTSQRLLHHQRRPIHLRIDVGRDFIGQYIGNPDQARARIAVGDDLHAQGAILLGANRFDIVAVGSMRKAA
jgi:hypothetical protein